MDPDEEAALGLDPERALRGWKRPVYMVHEHHSRSHHYDLRLEFGGVLRSWAVPKGLSREPGVRRLAVQVPDHALGYAPFEGTIEEGSYGAGEVEVWDRGTFSVLEEGPDKLVVDIRGRKVNGVYHMVRTAMNGNPRNWLVFLGTWPPKSGVHEPVQSAPKQARTGPRRKAAPRPKATTRDPHAADPRRPPGRRSPASRPRARGRSGRGRLAHQGEGAEVREIREIRGSVAGGRPPNREWREVRESSPAQVLRPRAAGVPPSHLPPRDTP